MLTVYFGNYRHFVWLFCWYLIIFVCYGTGAVARVFHVNGQLASVERFITIIFLGPFDRGDDVAGCEVGATVLRVGGYVLMANVECHYCIERLVNSVTLIY